jgi:hypothetical protein
LFLDFFHSILFEFLTQLKKIFTFPMSSVIDEAFTVRYSTVILSRGEKHGNSIPNNDNQPIVDQLTDRYELPPYVIYGNGRRQFHSTKLFFMTFFEIIIPNLLLFVSSTKRRSHRNLVQSATVIFEK